MALFSLLHIIFLSLIIIICNSSDSECINNLIKWIKSNGGSISSSIEIRNGDNSNSHSRGVFTTDSISPNTKLASIPISILFTIHDARKLLKTMLPKHTEFTNSLGTVDTLSLALIIEYQNEDSFWSPYLKCLPTLNDIKTLNHPLFWSKDDINTHLQQSKVSEFINRRLNSIHDSYKEITEIMENVSYMKDVLKQFTFDHWIWALSIVWSRSFAVIIDHQKVKVCSSALD